VVTGAYHAAVFALSQGIPVVGLGRSDYCMNKFEGLRDLFGAGCDIVHLDGNNLSERLTAAIDRAWNSAEAVRPALLESSRRQIAAGREAYRNVYERVSYQSVAA
jgi:polysaccharide pyruvyl transferase WcaK-like protein